MESPSRTPIRTEAKWFFGTLLVWGAAAILLAVMFLYRWLHDAAGC